VEPFDIIVAVDGTPVSQVNELQADILTRRPGEEVELAVIRRGERRTFTVRLVEAEAASTRRPASPPATPQGTVSPTGSLGMTVSPVNAELVEEYEFEESAPGVVVTDAQRGSVAWRAGIRPGHRVAAVDGQAVGTPQELSERLQAKGPGEVVGMILLNPDGSRRIVTLRLPVGSGNGR
jgi:serine protease Do